MSLVTRDANAPHVVVIGGGITGLAAAWALSRPEVARDRSARTLHPRVTVLEADAVLGGKLRTSEFADLMVDTGPDAFLARTPAAVNLCKQIGMEADLVAPTGRPAWLLSQGELIRFPGHTILGVPGGLKWLGRSEVVGPLGVLRAGADYVLPTAWGRRGSDPSIGQVFGRRLGRNVVDRLIDPLVGGINGGSVDSLSLESASPQLDELAGNNYSVMLGARRRLKDRAERPSGPMFYAPQQGLASLVKRLCDQLAEAGAEVTTNAAVEGISKMTAGRWKLDVAGRDPMVADAVLIAVPAHAATQLVKSFAPDAAEALSAIRYASVSMIRLAYTTSSVEHPLDGSGYVTTPRDGGLLTACSWASSKWAHLQRKGQVVLRASAGRMQDARADDMSDEELIAAAHQELTAPLGLRRKPFAADVTRWTNSFPQYEVGHAERVRQIEGELKSSSGIAVAGAAFHGLGIPACIQNGSEQAEALLSQLGSRSRWRRFEAK